MPTGENQKPKYRESFRERFFSRCAPGENGCLEWNARKNKAGYGVLSVACIFDYKQALAHRVAWYLYTGEILDPKTVVMHFCDNPACVEKSHLGRGTQADNIADMVKKGRQMSINRGKAPRGSPIYNGVLADKKAGMLHTDMAEKYSVNLDTIGRVLRRERLGLP